jgi:hypothetical protein
MAMYSPRFDNPYPTGPWTTISDFVYATPLHLHREIESVQRRTGDDADYIVSRPYCVRFKLDGRNCEITVPAGLVTDLSSVPRLAWTLTGIGRVGPHLEASIVHDFLYVAWQSLGHGPRESDRRFADELLRVGMLAAGVNLVRAWFIYQAVRLFGRRPFCGRDEVCFVPVAAGAA